MSKKTICLTMIVKNESHIIANTLEHLWKYIKFDTWFISDTGSTDETKEIIIDFFSKKGVKGTLQEEPWCDFGYNRTKAFEGAYKKADYAFVWDADDEIHGNFNLPDNLIGDSYKFIFGDNSVTYSRPQLFNMNKKWCYRGVLHEYAECLESCDGAIDIIGNYFFSSGKSGNRSKNPNKYLDDALILEKASEKALIEKDSLYNRYIFYCACSYKWCNKKEKSIEIFKKGLSLSMWTQEKYVSCLDIYLQYEELKKPEEGIYYLIESNKYDSNRLECFYELIKYYCIRNMSTVSYGYYTVIQNFYENQYDPSTLSEKLFANKTVYEFLLPYYMIIVGESTHNLKTSAKMFECIFKYKSSYVSEWWIRNLIHNMQFCINELPADLNFLNNCINYLNMVKDKGVNFEENQLKVIDKLIDTYKPLIGSTPTLISTELMNKTYVNKTPVNIIITFTTCKRFDLFEKTINSLLHMWTDIDKIDYFYCVDDNSCQRDRTKMKTLFPFIDFYMKRKAEKGHRTSMNLIYNKIKELNPKFWIHMEDDWLFFNKDCYVQKSVDFLTTNENLNIHQILYNRNYAETYSGYLINGGIALEGQPKFILHEKSDKVQGINCAYWPHYSFRPSMIRVSTILTLGNYDSPNTFFERDYADKYFDKGYKSAFFNKVCCLHTGKLTSDKSGINAYALNNTLQFNNTLSTSNSSNSTFIVNLIRRVDRKEDTENEFEKAGISELDYEFIEAVDGKELELTDEINTLFLGNDFGSRKGVIGCALSHYNLWKQLVESNCNYYTIFEDDIKLCDGFKEKWNKAKNNLEEIDILFLGYHVLNTNKDEIHKSIDKKLNQQLNCQLYIGGTYGYIVTQSGAKKLLEYIKNNGIKHGIDYLIKIATELKLYNSQPHIVFSDWVSASDLDVDSDIQKDYSSLNIEPKVDKNEWVFHKGVDSGGGDIKCVGKKSVNELMIEASKYKNCIAFNTLGFLKLKIQPEFTPSQYYSRHNDGIYVKNNYMCKESMVTRQKEKESYEVNDLIGIAQKCDWFVYHNGYLNITNTDNPKTIYISSSYVFLPYNGGHSLQYFMDNLLHLLKFKFNLIIAGNDFTFPSGIGDERKNCYFDKQELISFLLNNPLLNKGFVENLDTLHPKLSPIPLGIMKNFQRGYHSTLMVTNEPINFNSRDIKCMCIHRIRDLSQFDIRKKVTQLCETVWSSFVTYYQEGLMDDDGLSQKMKNAKFCICVRGGGYDPSPKAWQALINGCIPIIQHSPLDEAYNRFPVAYVDDWNAESITDEKLDNWLNDLRSFYEEPEKRKIILDMLTLDYWWNIVKLSDSDSYWVSPYLCGGIGNRLFQTAAALDLAKKMGRELVFYRHSINNNVTHDVSEFFNMFPNVRIIEDQQHNFHNIYENDLEHYMFNDLSKNVNKDKNIVVNGYRQNYQYIPKDGIHQILKGQDKYLEYGLDSYDDKKNSWFIHVRLGDYRNHNNLNHITADFYYKKINSIPTNANVILFSDEPEVAETMIKQCYNINLRICNETNTSVIFGLMSQCWGGAIIPNSTFSWWGAYFARQYALKNECINYKAFYPCIWDTRMTSNNNCNPPWGYCINNKIDNKIWDFYEGLDSGGNDIKRIENKNIEDMKTYALNELNCVAFNSIGYLKSYIKFPLIKSPYVYSPGGLYVKKLYKPPTRIKMICNWCSSEDLCKEWLKMTKGNYKWNNLEITWKDTDIDYYIIINKPQFGEKYEPEKTIVYHMEPWCYADDQKWGVKTWGEWAKPDPRKFLQVRSHDLFVNTVLWQLNMTYDEIKNTSMSNLKTLDLVSSVCSSKYFDPGHKKRIDFLKYLELKDFPLHIYNEDNNIGFKSYKGTAQQFFDKEKAIIPYKYYFMCENNVEHNFVTEKMWEPILCESLCFYWGCPNINEIVDPMAFVQLDMDDFEASYNIMNEAIKMNLWETRLPYIKVAKQKILEQSFFPTLEKVLKPTIVCFIHSCNTASSGTEKLDLILDAVLKIKELEIIFINNIGLKLDSRYNNIDPRIVLSHSSDNPLDFELPTLRLLHQFSMHTPNTKVLYVHTKGISYTKNDYRYTGSLDWINYMLYFLCEKSKNCLELLDYNDVVGCNYNDNELAHFSGNFWWATTKYLKSLETSFLTDKMSAEWWLCTKNPIKSELWNSMINHYHYRYERNMYDN